MALSRSQPKMIDLRFLRRCRGQFATRDFVLAVTATCAHGIDADADPMGYTSLFVGLPAWCQTTGSGRVELGYRGSALQPIRLYARRPRGDRPRSVGPEIG